MKQRFGTIRSGTTQLDSLCSPTKVCALPFPQSFAPLCTYRFSIKATTWGERSSPDEEEEQSEQGDEDA